MGGGPGDEKLKDERQKETKHKQEGFQCKGKGETVEEITSVLSEGGGKVGKAQCGEGLDEEGAGGGVVKKGGAECPYNHQKSRFKE